MVDRKNEFNATCAYFNLYSARNKKPSTQIPEKIQYTGNHTAEVQVSRKFRQ